MEGFVNLDKCVSVFLHELLGFTIPILQKGHPYLVLFLSLAPVFLRQPPSKDGKNSCWACLY